MHSLRSQLPILLCVWLSGCQGGGGELNQTYELQGGKSETFTVTGDQERSVGFELVDKKPASGSSCPGQICARLERKDDYGSVGGQFGAATKFKPKEGKMVFEIKNLASFALKIRVFTEKP